VKRFYVTFVLLLIASLMGLEMMISR